MLDRDIFRPQFSPNGRQDFSGASDGLQQLLKQAGSNANAADFLGETLKNPTFVPGHGLTGLFNAPATTAFFSALALPCEGYMDTLPSRPSNRDDDVIDVLTGITPSNGVEPDGPCDPAPEAGSVQTMRISGYPFGKFRRSTKVLDLSEVGSRANAADYFRPNLVGRPFNRMTGTSMVPSGASRNARNVARLEYAKALFEMGAAWSLDFAQKAYTANPANNTANGGYKEYKGMQLLVNNGYVDQIAGAPNTTLDPRIRTTFDGSRFDDSTTNLLTMVREIVENVNYLVRFARKRGLGNISLKFVMPYNLFRILVFNWPYMYATYRQQIAQSDNGARVNYSGEAMGKQMLTMLNERYLEVDGRRIPVHCDETMPEADQTGGIWQSDIYLMCESVLGGARRTVYREHFNFGASDAAGAFIREFGQQSNFKVRDGGMFLQAIKPPTGFCIQNEFMTKPRLRVDVPWLCARWVNVQYAPYILEDKPFRGDPNYVGGGSTVTP